MKETYCVSFALSNSHHSIEFKNYEKIYLPELFQDIGKIYFPKTRPIEELPKRLSLSYNKENKEERNKGKEIVKPLKIVEPEKSSENFYNELLKLYNQIKTLSNKI